MRFPTATTNGQSPCFLGESIYVVLGRIGRIGGEPGLEHRLR